MTLCCIVRKLVAAARGGFGATSGNRTRIFGMWYDGYMMVAARRCKGHRQFTNNGTKSPFDYTAEDYGWSSPFNPCSLKRH